MIVTCKKVPCKFSHQRPIKQVIWGKKRLMRQAFLPLKERESQSEARAVLQHLCRSGGVNTYFYKGPKSQFSIALMA
jgi:hypothetical protein